jgi:hypothetical protein
MSNRQTVKGDAYRKSYRNRQTPKSDRVTLKPNWVSQAISATEEQRALVNERCDRAIESLRDLTLVVGVADTTLGAASSPDPLVDKSHHTSFAGPKRKRVRPSRSKQKAVLDAMNRTGSDPKKKEWKKEFAPKGSKKKVWAPKKMTPTMEKIFSVLPIAGSVHISQIVQKTKVSLGNVANNLTQMIRLKRAKRMGTGFYARNI